MEHIELNHIGEYDAEKLFRLARAEDRVDDLMQEFESWVGVQQEELEEEAELQAEKTGEPAKAVKRWPSNYLSQVQIKAWMESLNDGKGFFEAARPENPKAESQSGTALES
jgi:hypothetical protein